MATEADLIQKFKDLDIPVGADFEELIHAAFASSNLADQINSKADDSKVVHTADMRKPANQVASIDEVNTKQDKIGYTPADDSKVVRTSDMRKPASDVVGLEDITQTALPDGTAFYTLLNTAGRPLQYFVATFIHAQTMINKPVSVLSAFILITSAVNNSTTTAYNYTFLNLRDVSSGYSYEALINTDGTGKITVVRPWHKLADDSKVAHLSGANNFDTVPTVNNNPLLLASSLPTDLARTSQQTNFTAGLQSGGVDVATAADLKSVEDKAWHMKSLPDVPALKNISLLYQVDDTNKKMNIVLNGSYSSTTADDSTGLLIADFSDIIQGIIGISIKSNTNRGGFYYYDQSMQQSPNVANNVNIVFSGTKLYMNTGSNSYPRLQLSGADYLCLMYGSTISYTKLA